MGKVLWTVRKVWKQHLRPGPGRMFTRGNNAMQTAGAGERTARRALCSPHRFFTTTLKGVVTYDNIRLEQEFEAHWVDQGGAQGVRDISRAGEGQGERRRDDHGQGRQGRHRQAAEGSGPGVFQIAIRRRTDAWRVVYVTELAGRLWVVHALRKKSKMGIKTPKPEVDVISSRLARLKREVLS